MGAASNKLRDRAPFADLPVVRGMLGARRGLLSCRRLPQQQCCAARLRPRPPLACNGAGRAGCGRSGPGRTPCQRPGRALTGRTPTACTLNPCPHQVHGALIAPVDGGIEAATMCARAGPTERTPLDETTPQLACRSRDAVLLANLHVACLSVACTVVRCVRLTRTLGASALSRRARSYERLRVSRDVRSPRIPGTTSNQNEGMPTQRG